MKSFRFKIIFSLVLTISVITIIGFYFYHQTLSNYLNQRHERRVVSVLNLLKKEFYTQLGSHDGNIIYALLDSTLNNRYITNAYLFNSEGKYIYPPGKKIDSLIELERFHEKQDYTESGISMRILTEKNNQEFGRAFISMENEPACYKCHDPSQKLLGTIVFDLTSYKKSSTLTFITKYSIIFTLIMLVLISGIIFIFHFKFIRSALTDFYNAIIEINKGKLDTRLSIPKTNELGQLGTSFNQMLESFQLARDELQKYHDQELQQKQKMASVGEMASRLAHEIRNPITGIASSIEIIEEEISDQNQELKPVLNEIKRQAERVNKAITELLKYSREKKLDLAEGNINELIKSVVFFLKNQKCKAKISFKSELDKTIPNILFDKNQLEDVLLNLAINASQSIETEGEVLFVSKFLSKENKIRITVSDSGKGIPEEIIEKIFHPFFTTRNSGTGLGLAIAKDIIEKHNGQIYCENNTMQGASFHIILPILNNSVDV